MVAKRDWALIAGRALSAIVILFMLMDSTMKLIPIQPAIDATAQLGWPADIATIRLLGVILLVATALYAWPRTALLGSILLTAYLGGAVATHLRIGSPLFSHILFGVYLGVLTWGGLWLREPRLRSLLSLESSTKGARAVV
jgi:hypothetical protein